MAHVTKAFRTEIEKTFRFEAAHRLPNVPPDHKCARLHGHSFRVTLVVSGNVGEDTGWICDFADIAAAWAPLHDQLDHYYLNEVKGLENPTSEHLARWIAERLDGLAGLSRVVVSETCTSQATVRVLTEDGNL